MRRKFIIITAMLVQLMVKTGFGEASLINTAVPEFTLQDQFGTTFTLKQFRGSILVLIASDKEGSEQKGPWRKALIDRYKDGIVIVGVADLRTVPFFLKGSIKSGFKKDPASILMDWKAEVFTALELKKNVSNIVVIDQKGNLRYLTSGAGTDGAIAKLFAEIDGLK